MRIIDGFKFGLGFTMAYFIIKGIFMLVQLFLFMGMAGRFSGMLL